MFAYSHYQLVGLPVIHAAGLGLWSLMQPEFGPAPLLWWLLWLPVLRLLYNTRTAGLVFAGALPFLGLAAWHWLR